MRFVKLISFFVVFIQGCNYNDSNLDTSINIPVYRECLSTLKKFISSDFQSRAVTYDIQEFDVISDAHPDLVGYVSISGKNTSDLEEYKNTVKLICIPSSMIAMERSARNMNLILKDFDTLSSSGEAYLQVDKDNIRIFYNEKNISWFE